MTRRIATAALLATSLALVATACSLPVSTPTAPAGQAGARASNTKIASTGSTSRPSDDDPSGESLGKAAPVGPPPPPLPAAAQASGQLASQDVVAALAAEQDMDAYTTVFDNGDGIVAAGGGNIVAGGGGNIVATGGGNVVAAGAGNIVAAGAGNYALLADMAASADAGASAAPTPKPPRLASQFRPSLDAIATTAVREKIVAQRQVEAERLAARVKKLPELGSLRDGIKSAAWESQADGTIRKTIELDVEHKVGGVKTHRHTIVIVTRDPGTKLLLHYVARFDTPLDNGQRRVTDREVVLLGDGSRHVHFSQSLYRHDGKPLRVTTWDKTIAISDDVTGTGSVVYTAYKKSGDVKVQRRLEIELAGTVDAPAAHAVDPATKLDAKVALTPEGDAQAHVRDVNGSTGDVPVAADKAPLPDPNDESNADAAASGAAQPDAAASATTAATGAASPAPVKDAGATTTADAAATTTTR